MSEVGQDGVQKSSKEKSMAHHGEGPQIVEQKDAEIERLTRELADARTDASRLWNALDELDAWGARNYGGSMSFGAIRKVALNALGASKTTRDLSATEAASFIKTFARSPRWIETPADLTEAIWQHCRVVFYPGPDDAYGDYPLEHAPGANKDMRAAIEHKLRERSAQKAKSDPDLEPPCL